MRYARSLITVGVACACLLSTAALAGTNNCTDPYWSDTLRCQLAPGLAPQPVPAAPATIAELRSYTRVDLTLDADVRCVDGTRPILYVSPAAGGPSNRWLISMGGGGWCAAEDLDQNGSFESGQQCLDAYISGGGNFMGTASEPAMSNLRDEPGPSPGILNPDAGVNPVFAGYNRIRVQKCGYDRHSGRATHLGVSAQGPVGPSFQYDLYNHGQKIVLEALETLRGQGAGMQGLTYTTYVNNAGTVATAQVTLPSIADAEQVLLVAHSSAAHGLYQNADRYAQALRDMPGFSGDIRAVHDAQFMHMAENEAAFDPAQNPNPLNNNTLFDQRYSGVTMAVGTYDAQPYHDLASSPFVEVYRAWLETPVSSLGTILDASCVASHQGVGDVWKCRDRFHVRVHHETTTAFVREDFSDPNGEHTDGLTGYLVRWGPPGDYPHCGDVGTNPCPPRLTIPAYQARLLVQAAHFLNGFQSLSEMATGADASGPPGSAYLWMPNCQLHVGVYDDASYYDTRIGGEVPIQSYREFLEEFVQAPASGVMVGRVTQMNGAVSECAPRLLANGFD
jgi:hypothetical protein